MEQTSPRMYPALFPQHRALQSSTDVFGHDSQVSGVTFPGGGAGCQFSDSAVSWSGKFEMETWLAVKGAERAVTSKGQIRFLSGVSHSMLREAQGGGKKVGNSKSI